MTSHEIRARFLQFFAERGHEVVASSSLIPHGDPTLLFTNAGMNQFKAVLLGQERRGYVRAASSQKCMRVSGKHNDLEAVGRDGRHHTFFEMLGNWSFGDYYKQEAIVWAWEFLTQEMGLDPACLSVSIYKDDDDAFAHWTKVVGVDAKRVHRLGDVEAGDEENFWSMGETGPCGPCTELYFDRGVELACGPKCGIGRCDCDRWLEIWNLVFIQYDRDGDGKLSPLPLQSVDTGMGLERIAAVKAGVSSNYLTDLFTPLVDWAARTSGMDRNDPEHRVSMQVIADHVRALAFSVADGGRPGNDGRGYVLRRILRRAARHGRRLGFHEPFLYRAAEVVIETMGGHYHELREAHDHIVRVIRTEEERFNETLDRGLARFDDFAAEARRRGDETILGAQAFQLHDTFGFPVDLTQVMADEKGLRVDSKGFEAAMQQQRERARASSKFSSAERGGEWRWIGGGEPGADRPASEFVGYDRLEESSQIIGLRALGENRYELVLEQTPFYAESGGQVGDVGLIEAPEGLRLRVLDTQPSPAGPVHVVELEMGSLEGEGLDELVLLATVDAKTRRATMLNHTATHLLHAELRRQLGTHATQAGSLVNAEKLRFDFHHEGALSKQQMADLEAAINVHIAADSAVTKHVDVPIAKAKAMGAVSMFGEKYGENVRVVEVPGLSIEFCGGTHLDRIGDIGMFRFTGQSAVGAGVRRVEAITGAAAVAAAAQEHAIVGELGERLSARPEELVARLESLQTELKRLQKQLSEARKVGSGNVIGELLEAAVSIGGAKLVVTRRDFDDRGALMQLADALRDRLGSGVAVLGGEVEGKVSFLCVVTDDLIARGVRAGDLVKEVAAVAGGSGGGKPHLAQAGGKDASKIDAALAMAETALRKRLS